jgi:hypothetical protein
VRPVQRLAWGVVSMQWGTVLVALLVALMASATEATVPKEGAIQTLFTLEDKHVETRSQKNVQQAALCITGQARSFRRIYADIGREVISPIKKFIGSDKVDVFLITSGGRPKLTEAKFASFAKTWGIRYSKLVEFNSSLAQTDRFRHMVQFYNFELCGKEIAKTGNRYSLVGKTRTDILPLVKFKIQPLQPKEIIGCHSYPIDAPWIKTFGFPYGDLCAFGGQEAMGVYWRVMQYFYDLEDHHNVSAPLKGPKGTEYYVYNNLLTNGIRVTSSPQFTKVKLHHGRPVKKLGTMIDW